MVRSTRAWSTLLCSLFMAGTVSTAGAADVPVTTLSHNVDSANWVTIGGDILTSLSAESADIMSLQEVLSSSDALADLKTTFGTYDYSAGYFDDNPTNEVPSNITDNPIFWRASVFNIDWARSGAVSWPGMTGLPMDLNWVTLTHIASGIEIMVFNTHLSITTGDAENLAANQSQAVFLTGQIETNRELGQIAIITGDMNADNTTPTMEFLLGGEQLLGGTFSMAFADVEGSTKQSAVPIDYIMVPSILNLDCASVDTVDTSSDHDLVVATINLDDGDDASVAACEDRAFITPTLDQGTVIDGTRTFDLDMASGLTRFFPFDVDTPTSGYNGTYLGPSLEMRTGEDVQLNVTNSLGGRETTTHWHGLHIPAAMDGGPHQSIVQDATWEAVFPILNRASTYWYHPHPHAMSGAQDTGGTAHQVYEGMAGMLIIRDDATDALAIPQTYGTDEFPLIVQDKAFNPDGTLFHLFPMGAGEPILRRGGNFLTNGVVSAESEMPAQVVRFRVLNASNARYYNFGMKDDRTFYQIGSDGGLLNEPVAVTRMLLGPSERAEILVDFGSDQDRRVTLRAYNSEVGARLFPNVIADTWDRTDFDIADFNITAPTGAPITTVVSSLVPVVLIPEGEAHNLSSPRPFQLDLSEMINGLKMNIDFINETINLGATEVWILTNVTQIAHPLHVHGDSFQILTRDGIAPPDTEAGWKDSVRVEPGEVVRIIKRFYDYADPINPFMYHCHILDHEDAGMMGQFVVVDPCGDAALSPASCKAAEAGKSQLQIRDREDDGKDQYKWKWIKGEETTLDEFADPVNATPTIAVCLFDTAGTSLLLSTLIPAGGTCNDKDCWKTTGTNGYKYKDKAGTQGGVTQIKLREGIDGKAKVQVKAKGTGLQTPGLPLSGDVTMQLLIDDGVDTACFQTIYTTPSKNEPDQYKAKGP